MKTASSRKRLAFSQNKTWITEPKQVKQNLNSNTLDHLGGQTQFVSCFSMLKLTSMMSLLVRKNGDRGRLMVMPVNSIVYQLSLVVIKKWVRQAQFFDHLVPNTVVTIQRILVKHIISILLSTYGQTCSTR